jgi:hypothetical protein
VRRITILAAAGVVLLLLVIAQLVLPGIAAQRLRDKLARSGDVLKIEVEAFPAIELLWHQADKVVVRVGRYRSGTANLGNQLQQAGDVGTLDASATELDSGLLTLRDAKLRKRGDELTGAAHVTEADLRSALPILQNVQPVASGDGTLTLRGTATLFGLTATIDATARAEGGRLIVAPNVPFGGFATLTLFDNPHVAVEGVGATSTPDGFDVTARAKLR